MPLKILMLGVASLAVTAGAAIAQTSEPTPPSDPPPTTQTPAPAPPPQPDQTAPPAEPTTSPPAAATATPPAASETVAPAEGTPTPPADPTPPPPAEAPATASPQASETAPAAIVRAVTQADLPVGATVYDQAGVAVGTIESPSAENAVIFTGSVRARVPLASLGVNAKGLVIGLTKAQLEAAAAAQSQPPAG